MDDSQQSLAFKLRKVVRYLTLYGPRRTSVKVRGRWAATHKYDRLPPNSRPQPGQTVGLIGCGNYAFTNIAYFLARSYGRVIGACMDVDVHRAVSLSRYFRVPRYTADAGELIEDDSLRMIYIASNHASHAEYAIEALNRGKDVYIEKPHVVDAGQLDRLSDAMRRSQGRVYVGFNRPSSRLARSLYEHVHQESGPAMYNWFVAGHKLSRDHWYLREGEGGRVLGNLCHWTDFLLWLVGPEAFPIRIRPTGSDESNMAVSLTFADGTVGVITFSEKGNPFEGVNEHLCGHRGELLFSLDCFQRLKLQIGPMKRTIRLFYRNHGHRASICDAYHNATTRLPYDRQARHAHILNTAWLFLNTKQALDDDREIVVNAYEPTNAAADAA